ncbi:MAG: trypsin-like peptidase domain-containing protein [Defluviitaleaceae bacterium]|nr:trypsin-like peptidase domain-containing protein [Defluviitaleaceae bacterium]
MSDDINNTNDLFGLSDIEKIQEDIEKDLSGFFAVSPQANEEFPILPVSEEFADFFLVPENSEISESPAEPTSFYRETIKNPGKSWVKTAVILLIVCTLGTGMLGFGIGMGWAYFRGQNDETAAAAPRVIMPENTSFTGASYVFEAVDSEPAVASLADMVELLTPSVVGITTYRDESRFPLSASTSYGTGIIFADSHDRIFIATNLYVVRGGYRWEVSIAGSEPVSAFPVGMQGEIISIAASHDLAVAYVYRAHLVEAGINSVTFATFGDSDLMRIGDDVLAIGNAMGEGTSVTRGIISAPERPVYLPGRQHPLTVLQTDAAINYGNSGGPLINTRGEVVGININQATGLIVGPSPVEGMGYSISSNIAAPILNTIAATYRRPAIGIIGGDLANDIYNRAEQWGIPPLGVLVSGVMEGRPAALAGIRQHDVITSFDGQPIFDLDQLIEEIAARNIGDVVEVRILRGGTFALTLQVELAMMVRDTF